MPALPLGNLAQSMITRQAQTRIQSDLSRLSLELTTGLTENVASATRGDTRSLTALNRQIEDLDAYKIARSEAKLLAESSQTALTAIQSRLVHVREGVVAVTQGQDAAQHRLVADQARDSFIGAIQDLNGQSGGRSLFTGTAQDQPATRNAEDILTSIKAASAGSLTAADLSTALGAYFAPGGAFETTDYLGSTTDLQAIRIGPEDRVAPAIRADDPAIRDALKTMATLVILPDLAMPSLESKDTIDLALDNIIDSERGLITVQSQIGAAEAHIDIAASRSAGAKAAFETARLDTLGIDPFATAARLEETQTQLQTLYTLTARLSGLNLVNFL